MSKNILVLIFLFSVASACQKNPLGLKSRSFKVGHTIDVTFPTDCDLNENVEDPSSSFLAIYPSDTQLEDIQGDANYHVWMWTCGSQVCRLPVKDSKNGGGVATTSSVTFSVETTDERSWPLAAGSYQVHLVQRLTGQTRFSSVAQTPVFVVEQEVPLKKNKALAIKLTRRLADEEVGDANCADDSIHTSSQCFQEGNDFEVIFHNACGRLKVDDWFGIFPVDDCDSDTRICQGEPVIWTMACSDQESCQKNQHFRFKGMQNEKGATAIVLPAGEYRAALVTSESDHGEGPYYAQVLSEHMLVQRQGISCHVTERLS
jgi:hypothetical protein